MSTIWLAEEQRELRRKPPEVPPLDRRLELAHLYGNQALARMLARQPAVLDPPATSEPLAPGIPGWIQAIYVTSGVLMAHEATALLNQAGAFAVQRFSRCFEFERDPIEARRVHYGKNSGRAAILDWDKTHPEISPADPQGTKPLKPGYGTLRDVFYRHRAQLLFDTFGVQSLDLVITAAEVAEYAGDTATAERIRDLMFQMPPVRDRRDAQRDGFRPLPAGLGQDLLQHLRLRLRDCDGRLPAARVVDGQDVVQDPGRRGDRHTRRAQAHEEGEGGRLQRRRADLRRDRRTR